MSHQRVLGVLLAAASLLAGCGMETPLKTDIIPRCTSAPVLDGRIDDDCWRSAIVVRDFARPRSDDAPTKTVEARLVFDDKAIYVAFKCQEPNPSRIAAGVKTEGTEHYMDDCVEINIRTSANMLDRDLFAVTTTGTRGWVRQRGGVDVPVTPVFRTNAAVGRDAWTAEMAIPYSDLGLSGPPARGEMWEVKLGRIDHAGEPSQTCVWPAGAKYAGVEDFTPVYFEDSNLLRNSAMTAGTDGITSWDNLAGSRVASRELGKKELAVGGGRDVIRVDSGGRQWIATQVVGLKPNRVYRLSAMARGYGQEFRVGAFVGANGEAGRRFITAITLADSYAPVQLTFNTGASGTTVVAFSAAECASITFVEMADLRLVEQPGFASVGPAIPLNPNETLTATKLLVTDCRNVRGFVGSPIDGTTDSIGWDAQYTEYNRRDCGQGVGYAYHGNDGLHLKFADKKGFDAVVVRGGVKTDLYRDCPSWTGPKGGTLLAKLPGMTRDTTRILLDKRAETDSVSFYNADDGYISDVTFLRLGRANAEPWNALHQSPLPEQAKWWPVDDQLAPTPPDRLAPRFGDMDRRVLRFHNNPRPFTLTPLRLETCRYTHFISPLLIEETPLESVTLHFSLDDIRPPLNFTIRVQDPIDPRRELYSADFTADKPGEYNLVLDFPDQIVPKGKQMWLSIKPDSDMKLSNVAIRLNTTDRVKALPEAMAYRKLILHGLYCAMSEARPWGWYSSDAARKYLAGDSPWVPGVQAVLDNLDHCMALGGDDEVRQYYEWIWRNVLRKEGRTPPFQAKFDIIEGAPHWACLARQAWLQCRDVPKWWLDNRLVPTGEFGGTVNDDTDMYQNFTDFVMFENDGVAARLKAAGAGLAQLAEQTTMVDGVNIHTMDPLHAYEEGLNHEALMAFWFYGDPVYLERCMAATLSLEQLTEVTPKGHRHFRSQNIGASRRTDPATDTDGQAHPLMWHPSLELARYSANPTAVKLMRQWADGWLAHNTADRYADAVNVATETVTSSSKTPLAGIYGGQGAAFEALFLATGDKKYIEPFLQVFRQGSDRVAPGEMILEFYHKGLLDGIEAPRLQELLKKDPVAYAAATGNKQPLCEALRESITELQRYKMMYTTVECFTDRVFMGGPMDIVTKTYTGGFATRNKISRTHAVSYEGLGTDYAALVLAAGPDRFKVLIYNFADHELQGRLRLWTLDHGMYELSAGVDADEDDTADKIDRKDALEVEPATAVDVTLPARKVYVLELKQTKTLDDVRDRADLALSPLDTRAGMGRVDGYVHNIGNKAAPVVLVLLDRARKEVARQEFDPLPAATNCVSTRIAFQFTGLPADMTGWSVVVDPDNKVKEIYKGNNRVDLEACVPTSQPTTAVAPTLPSPAGHL